VVRFRVRQRGRVRASRVGRKWPVRRAGLDEARAKADGVVRLRASTFAAKSLRQTSCATAGQLSRESARKLAGPTRLELATRRERFHARRAKFLRMAVSFRFDFKPIAPACRLPIQRRRAEFGDQDGRTERLVAPENTRVDIPRVH
jgi:hypothetical protein